MWTSPQARVSERPSGRAVAGPAEGRALCETPGPRRLAGSGPGERSPQGALHVAFTPLVRGALPPSESQPPLTGTSLLARGSGDGERTLD